ncbi:MAG TPA: lipoprotein [Alphaproteobacteria bacterium]
MTRRALLAALLAAFGLSLGACGRRGPPTPPEDADPNAPRRYPTR